MKGFCFTGHQVYACVCGQTLSEYWKPTSRGEKGVAVLLHKTLSFWILFTLAEYRLAVELDTTLQDSNKKKNIHNSDWQNLDAQKMHTSVFGQSVRK